MGEVGGVLEIIRPLDRDIARTREGLRGTFVLMAVVSGALLVLSGLVLRRRGPGGSSEPARPAAGRKSCNAPALDVGRSDRRESSRDQVRIGSDRRIAPGRQTMSRYRRREFLADVGRGMLVASVGSALAQDLGLAPAALADDGAAAPDVRAAGAARRPDAGDARPTGSCRSSSSS